MPFACPCHQMHMTGHQAPCIKFQSVVLLAVAQAFNEYVLIGHSGEHIRPSNGGKADEADADIGVELIAGAHGDEAVAVGR